METSDLFPRSLKVVFENLHAIMTIDPRASSLWVIWIRCLSTVFALHLEVLALLHAVVLHVTAQNAESAALRARQELMLALLEVFHGLLVSSSEVAFWCTTFELERK